MIDARKPIALMLTSDRDELWLDRRITARILLNGRASGAIYGTVRGRLHDAPGRPHSRFYMYRDGASLSVRTYPRTT